MHMHGWPRFQPIPQVDYLSCDVSVGASGPALVMFVLFVVSSTSVQGYHDQHPTIVPILMGITHVINITHHYKPVQGPIRDYKIIAKQYHYWYN